MEMWEILYNRLPEMYRTEDANSENFIIPSPIPPGNTEDDYKYHLQKFLKVAGSGMDLIINGESGVYEGSIVNQENITDIYNCKESFLDYILMMYSIPVQYDMTASEKRTLIENMPTLIANKGSAAVFEFLARTIYLEQVEVAATRSWDGAETEFRIDVDVSYMGTPDGDTAKRNRFIRIAEYFRPLNHRLYITSVPDGTLSDRYDRRGDSEELVEIFTGDEYAARRDEVNDTPSTATGLVKTLTGTFQLNEDQLIDVLE